MSDQCTVVPGKRDVTEAEFHAALLTGVARCTKAVGLRAVAQAMDLSTKQLGNIQHRGAMPSAKAQWDATAACPTALCDVAALYGLALVPLTAAEDGAGTLPLATLLQAVAEAEAPESEGGAKKTHAELLKMETHIRAVNRLTNAWLAQIAGHRGLSPALTAVRS